MSLNDEGLLLILEDIDGYFSGRDGYAGTQTQERLIVTMDTVIFLKELGSETDRIAIEYRKKGQRFDATWAGIRNKLDNLRGIVWLHVVQAQIGLYGLDSFMDAKNGIDRDVRMTPFRYPKSVVYPATKSEETVLTRDDTGHLGNLLSRMAAL